MADIATIETLSLMESVRPITRLILALWLGALLVLWIVNGCEINFAPRNEAM